MFVAIIACTLPAYLTYFSHYTSSPGHRGYTTTQNSPFLPQRWPKPLPVLFVPTAYPQRNGQAEWLRVVSINAGIVDLPKVTSSSTNRYRHFLADGLAVKLFKPCSAATVVCRKDVMKMRCRNSCKCSMSEGHSLIFRIILHCVSTCWSSMVLPTLVLVISLPKELKSIRVPVYVYICCIFYLSVKRNT